MSDLSLQRFVNDGIELIIDTSNGDVFASQAAIARMCKCESTQIRRLVGDSLLRKTLQVKDLRGVSQSMKLYPEQLIKECFAKFNPELLLRCGDAGLRVFLHRMAGFEITSSAVAPSISEYRPSKALLASREVKEIHENIEDISPRLKQFLIDCCINEVIDAKFIRPADEPKLRGVVEIAQDMGHKVNQNNRSQLGRFVKSVLPHLAQTEKRLCNGTEREIAVYPDTDEVRQCISQYFA